MTKLKSCCRQIGLCGAMALLGYTGWARPATNKPPNIIFIMGDDHTAQSWGIYGGVLKDYVQAHNIKRLAASGAVLDNVFCTNSICAPSRATILTGQYSHQNGVYTLRDALDPAADNIAKILQASGYRTALFGKWHLGKKPAGFDAYKILPGQGQYFNPSYLESDEQEAAEPGSRKYQGFVDDITTDMCVNWMKEQDGNQPFFVMCHFKSTHEPFAFAPRFSDLYKDVRFPYPPGFEDSGAITNGRSFLGQRLEVLGERYEKAVANPSGNTYPELPFTTKGLSSIEARKKIYQKFIRDYLRCAAGIDENIGKILDYLKTTGQQRHTVVIYTSDQGYFLGEHDFMDKRMMYEPALRMPFVISYPQEIPAGTRVTDMILNIDFAALFADFAGIKKPRFIQGESFRKNLQGQTPKDWRQDMYYRYWQHLAIRPAHLGIRDQRYKLIFFYGKPLGSTGAEHTVTAPAWEFYDLQTDPHELHNAIADPDYQPVIKRLKKRLRQLKSETGDQDAAYPEINQLLLKP